MSSRRASTARLRCCRRTCAREYWACSKLFVALCFCLSVAEIALAARLVLTNYTVLGVIVMLFRGVAGTLAAFWALKVLPWIVGFVIVQCLQSLEIDVFVVTQMKAFSVAAPSIGFVVALTAWCLGSMPDSCHLVSVETIIVSWYVGLSAWASSVEWSLVRPLLQWPLSCAWLWSLVVMALCTPVVLATFFYVTHFDEWCSLAGVAVWALGTFFFHYCERLLCCTVPLAGLVDRTASWLWRHISRHQRAPRLSRPHTEMA